MTTTLRAAQWHFLGSLMLAIVSVSVPSHVCSAQDGEPISKWSNLQGKEIEAEFVRLTDKGVVLRLKANGREAEVPFSGLSIESHYNALKLAKPEAFNKPLVKAADLKAIEIPEPDLKLTAEELLKDPFAEDLTIDQYLDVMRNSSATNPLLAWHGLPPKMRDDVESVIVKSMDIAGPAMLTQVRVLLRDLNTIVRDKREFVMNNPLLAGQPQVVPIAEQLWPSLAGTINALANEQHWQPDNFKKGNVERWLASFAAETFPHLKMAFDEGKSFVPPGAMPDLEGIQYKVLSQSAGRAEVEVTVPGLPPKKVNFQKVGKLWIDPASMNSMRKQVDTALEALDKGEPPQMSGIRLALGGVIAVVGQLARAETQEEFDEAVERLKTMTAGMVPPGMGSPAAGPPGTPR